MIVYELGPIDMWFGWTPLQKVLAIASKPFSERGDWCHHSAGKLEYALAHAQQLAKLLGWERDMREGPYFSPLPENDTDPAAFLLAWKQDNNGTTFVASPYRLPWLDKSCDDWASDENGIHRSQSGREDQTVNKSPK
jgi:hypothetical protein